MAIDESVGGRRSNSPPAHHNQVNMDFDWQQFRQYLLQRMTQKTAEDRMRYAEQYASLILLSGYTQTSSCDSVYTQLLQLTANKWIHVMKALSAFEIHRPER